MSDSDKTIVIRAVPIKGYHAYKVKVPVGQRLTFSEESVVPAYEKMLAKSEGRPIGNIGVPLNGILYRNWESL